MNILLPCMEKLVQILFESKEIRKKTEIIRKYSSVDITPPIEEGEFSELEHSMPNNYTGLSNAEVFVMPSADVEACN